MPRHSFARWSLAPPNWARTLSSSQLGADVLGFENLRAQKAVLASTRPHPLELIS
jgi:hypothetical protein